MEKNDYSLGFKVMKVRATGLETMPDEVKHIFVKIRLINKEEERKFIKLDRDGMEPLDNIDFLLSLCSLCKNEEGDEIENKTVLTSKNIDSYFKRVCEYDLLLQEIFFYQRGFLNGVLTSYLQLKK